MISAPSSRAKKTPQKQSGNSGAQISAHWQGPLPPPESLNQFNAIVDDGAERIFRMAELEQQHRIDSERAALDQNIKASQTEAMTTQIGVTFGAIISVLSIVACLLSVWMRAHWSVSIALVGLPIMGAIRAMITRK